MAFFPRPSPRQGLVSVQFVTELKLTSHESFGEFLPAGSREIGNDLGSG